MAVEALASDNDDNDSIDLPLTPPHLQRLRASTRPAPEDDVDDSSPRREGIVNDSSLAAPAAAPTPARQRLSGLNPLGPSSPSMEVPADRSEDGQASSESEVFDRIVESATTTTTAASEEAGGRCCHEHCPRNKDEREVYLPLHGGEKVGKKAPRTLRLPAASH